VPLPTVFTVREAADHLRISTRSVQILCASGRLPSFRPSLRSRGPIRIREADLLALMNDGGPADTGPHVRASAAGTGRHDPTSA